MDMGTPQEFFVVNKEKRTDLLKTLKPITWTSLENKGKAFESSFKLKGMGDYVFCLVPAPYYEKGEDTYIQQITKMIVNNGSLPTDWDADMGLKASFLLNWTILYKDFAEVQSAFPYFTITLAIFQN